LLDFLFDEIVYECNWQQNLACIAAFTEIFTFNNRPNLNNINSLTLTIAAVTVWSIKHNIYFNRRVSFFNKMHF